MKPKLAILIAAVLTLHYCSAAPSGDMLPRPSPINPNIPMDPKPAETITLITDPKEIAKFKREIHVEATTLYVTAPTTISPTHPHPLHQPEQADDHNESSQKHRQKRDSKTSSSVTPQTPQQKPTIDKLSQKSTSPLNDKKTVAVTSSTPTPPKRNRNRPTSTTSTTSTRAPARSTTKAASQIKHRQKRDNKDATVPLVYRDQHKQPISEPLTHEVTSNPTTGSHEIHELTSSTPISPSNLEQKSTIQPQTLPFLFSDPKTSHKESKRDIPVPLVPKYHHPEETVEAENKQDTKTASKETVVTPTNKPAEHPTSVATTSTQHNTESTLEKKPKKRTATENPDAVQVEDLSEHHEQHKQETSSTTESTIFRPRPVPVAELFAKGKPTETAE